MQLRTMELIQRKTSPATASCQIYSISPFVGVLIICLSLEIGACTENIILYCLIEISLLFTLVCVFSSCRANTVTVKRFAVKRSSIRHKEVQTKRSLEKLGKKYVNIWAECAFTSDKRAKRQLFDMKSMEKYTIDLLSAFV